MLRRPIVVFLFAFTLPFTAVPQNQLRDHPSPYLAMHAEDPVQWQEWGEAVLERARRERKPLFISSGNHALTEH